MAQPPPTPPRPGRQIAALGLLFVILFAMVFFAGTSGMSWTDRLKPQLGLDLVGGTRVTLLAQTLDGEDPSEDSLERAREIIENRVNARGVEEAEVVTEGSNRIVISLAGQSDDSLRQVGDPAELRFRKVIQWTMDSGYQPSSPDDATDPEDADGADSEESDAAEEGDAAEGDAAEEGDGSAEGSGTGGGVAAEDADDESAADESAGDQPEVDASYLEGLSLAERQAAVREKIGDEAWDAALALTDPNQMNVDPELAEVLQPFLGLAAAEVAVLPARVQFHVPAITCEQLDNRPAGSIQRPEQLVVACERGAKYLLDESSVLGTHVSRASAVLNETSQWVVSLDFNGEGREKWTALTRESVNNNSSTPFDLSAWAEDGTYSGTRPIRCDEAALGAEGNCLVAVVLDNQVVSAPQIRQVLTGTSEISGTFTAPEAQLLASQLRYGALPLTFEAGEAQTVTATLGTEYLRAGLIAAGIGVLLVMIYSFFYYRLLGTVIFGSLILSSLLIYGALIVLGRQIGFTLTLAGISGFIVALGVAADSFVIYFERLKDEIRDGRTPRSAVPRAWVRARRTIISANVVSILAAVVLYIVSAGQVRGFAFALGLATVLDLVVVFTFRHPMMTLLARTKAFLSPRVSGLGRVLQQERGTPVGAGARVKEA